MTIIGAEVKVNSGGGPGAGSGTQALGPLIPLAAAIANAGQLVERKTVLEKTDHDLDFLITDQNTGLPLKNFPYVIKTSSGKSLAGRTNDEGRTGKIKNAEAEMAVIEVYDDIPPSIQDGMLDMPKLKPLATSQKALTPVTDKKPASVMVDESKRLKEIRKLVEANNKSSIDTNTIICQIYMESRFDANAGAGHNARGLMQMQMQMQAVQQV